MKTILLRQLLLLGMLLVSVHTVRAQTMFTVTGTATSTSSGYINGQSYTFVFTTGLSFAITGDSYNTGAGNLWAEENTAHDQLWASISGNGVTGSFIRPTANSTDPLSLLATYNTTSDQLSIVVHGETTTDIGLRTPGGQAIRNIQIKVDGTTNYAFSGVYAEPISYFLAYLGTYTPSSTELMRVGLATGVYVDFTATEVRIAAIPEPSVGAALAGLLALAWVCGCRWSRRS